MAATSNIAGVSVGRLVTGAISAIPAITTCQSIEDLFRAEGRMWAFFSWALVTNLGLVLGPIYASYVAVSLNWYILSSHIIFWGVVRRVAQALDFLPRNHHRGRHGDADVLCARISHLPAPRTQSRCYSVQSCRFDPPHRPNGPSPLNLPARDYYLHQPYHLPLIPSQCI